MFAILPVWRDFSYKFVGKITSGEFVIDFCKIKTTFNVAFNYMYMD